VNYFPKLKQLSKVFYPLAISISLLIYGIFIFHDASVYLRTPLILRQAVYNIENHKFAELQTEERDSLEKMILAKTCDPRVPCKMHYSNISKEMAAGYFQQTYEQFYWSHYKHININIILLNYLHFLFPLFFLLAFRRYLQNPTLKIINKKYGYFYQT
jgi:hypothetical protein